MESVVQEFQYGGVERVQWSDLMHKQKKKSFRNV